MEIYLIRHTTPIVDKGICYGQTDLDIHPIQFEEELTHIQSKLPEDITHFYSSPLKRCVTLTQRLTTDFETHKRLMELNFGAWENKKWDEINKTELNQWMADFVNIHPPQGENYITLYKRTLNFLESLLQTSHKHVAIVTHAGNIRSILSYILGLPLENSFRIHLDYGAVVHIQLEVDPSLCKLVSIQ
ncbi:MAG: alpha-ribazole phosphatase [Chitinophagales bacterium]|nr:alpha-ribazole phosphatase [Chitinophagales bacterium]